MTPEQLSLVSILLSMVFAWGVMTAYYFRQQQLLHVKELPKPGKK
jgi:hypothetical protein